MKLRASITLVCFLSTFVAAPAIADPTDRAPLLALNIHGSVPEAAAIGKQVVAAEQQLKTLADSAEAGTINEKQLAQGFALGEQVHWQTAILALYGEPAAHDLALRSTKTRWWIDHKIEVFRNTPKGSEFVQKVQQTLDSPKIQKMKAAAVEKLTKLINQQNFPAAEQLLIKTYSELWPMAGFIHPYGRGPIYKPFEVVDGAIRTEMTRQRNETAKKVLAEKSQLWLTQRDAFLQEIEVASTQLASTGSVSIDGQSISGPVAMEKLSQKWSSVHLELVKVAMLNYALGGQDQTSLVEQAKQLAGAMEKCFSDMIQADARAAAPELARQRYVEYVSTLAKIVTRVDQWTPERAFAEPLAALAAKAGLTESVANYTRATSEILRWREKVASAQTTSMQKEFALVTNELPQKLLSRSEFEGLYEPQQQHPLPMLSHSSYLVFPHLVEQTMKSKVSANDLVRLDGEKPYFVSQMKNGIYCRVPSSIKVESGLAGLTNDLLVDADHPPMTLTSAVALSTANLGEYESFGGEVTGVELSAFATRYITFPPIAGPLVARDLLPTSQRSGEPINSNRMESMAVQFSINPQWVAHRYFVSKVLPVPASAN
jgi:hypothetical protein